MAKITKRIKAIQEKVESGKIYDTVAALDLLKSLSTVKFDESLDASINLGIDARKTEQAVRGATVLPHGAGRTVKVAVFAQGENAAIAKKEGADVVGFEDLAELVKKGEFSADVVIATPDAMRIVGQLGQILGPKGLMPNPKVGTVTTDVATAVKNAKGGQIRYRTDKNGIIHCSIGRVSFSSQHLKDNLAALITDLKKLRPATMKGIFIKRITLSSTMGPGVAIDTASV